MGFSVLKRALGAAVVLGAVLALSGCAPGTQAGIDSLRQLIPGRAAVDPTPLDPNFAYLRVTRGRHVGLLWRGNMEGTPAAPVEVYYSSSGEVVRLQHGRVIGAVGLTTEWRRVEVTAPAWASVAAARQSAPFVRVRDVMPGYRSGVRDDLVLNVIPAPERSALERLDARALTWFEETVTAPAHGALRLPGTASDTLPPARYAVDLSGGNETVVYGEQCLDSEFCFTWQRWSAALQKPAAQPRQ
jgi:hypothetical protein